MKGPRRRCTPESVPVQISWEMSAKDAERGRAHLDSNGLEAVHSLKRPYKTAMPAGHAFRVCPLCVEQDYCLAFSLCSKLLCLRQLHKIAGSLLLILHAETLQAQIMLQMAV